MFGLRYQEKHAAEIQAGEYVLLGGVKLLHVREVVPAEGLLQLVTEAGQLLFSPNDVLRVA